MSTRHGLACAIVLRILRGEKSVFPPGFNPLASQNAEPVVFECIGCESTNTCKPHELASGGWELHKLPDDSVVVLCKDCKIEYAERRRLRAAMARTEAT